MSSPSPLVSVLTPVFNGAEHLARCIESVVAQTYTNWDLTVVNNGSTDQSLSIAREYAAKDPRIRIVETAGFLPKIENYNFTARQLSAQAKYCKFVYADDWIYPACLEDMVRCAEREPSVGIVGAYTTDGQSVLWKAPPEPAHRLPGREVARGMLLGGPFVFGSMSSLLIRADLVRKRPQLFDTKNPYPETAAYYDILQEADYGYVHQTLTNRRPTIPPAERVDSDILGKVCVFLKYGPLFLSPAEYRSQWHRVARQYYRVLANNLLRMRPRRYWQYHDQTLRAFGSHVQRVRLALSIPPVLAWRFSSPLQSLRKGREWWMRALTRTSSESGRQA